MSAPPAASPRRCPICGRSFVSTAGGRRYCGTECSRIANRWRDHQRRRGLDPDAPCQLPEAPAAREEPRRTMSLGEAGAACRGLGLSYGAAAAAARAAGLALEDWLAQQRR